MFRKRRKKKKKRIPLMRLLPFLIAGGIGWYYIETVKGFGVGVGAYALLWLGFKTWLRSHESSRLRKAGIAEVDQMTGEAFERFLGELFKRRGFKVSYTATSGDYGADLVLKDGKDIIVVQAKRYSSSVGVKAVQEIIGAIRMYNATEAWVVTNSYFTKQAVKLANINDVYLIDRKELIDMILDK
ncbi:restriction endonuclease [Lysinibacillus sp. LZ02]|uniref:restriction endonuclease n=1 Tax=Lysinibacillus sp. LZ02 TaxID=3420668 RepID=UPI003D36CE8D